MARENQERLIDRDQVKGTADMLWRLERSDNKGLYESGTIVQGDYESRARRLLSTEWFESVRQDAVAEFEQRHRRERQYEEIAAMSEPGDYAYPMELSTAEGKEIRRKVAADRRFKEVKATLIARAVIERGKVEQALEKAPAATTEEEGLERTLDGWEQTIGWLMDQEP